MTVMSHGNRRSTITVNPRIVAGSRIQAGRHHVVLTGNVSNDDVIQLVEVVPVGRRTKWLLEVQEEENAMICRK